MLFLRLKVPNFAYFNEKHNRSYTNKQSEIKIMDKSEIKKNYKISLTPMGVYQIKNLVTGKIFIGSSKNLQARINRHKFELKFGSEAIKELQDDYNKYGEQNFSFEIIDELKPKEEPGINYKEDIEVLEQLWIEKLQPFDEKGYNIR